MKEFILNSGAKVTVDNGRVTLPSGKVIGDERGMYEFDALPAHISKPFAAQWASTPTEQRTRLVWFAGAIIPRDIAEEAQKFWEEKKAAESWRPEGYAELFEIYLAWEFYEERKERAYERESVVQIQPPSKTIEEVRAQYPDAYAYSLMSRDPRYTARVRNGEDPQRVLAEYQAARLEESIRAVDNN
jgi:hypothetical protein